MGVVHARRRSRSSTARPRERRATYRRVKRGYLLINYEQLLRDFEEVAAWKPDIVVLDEAQRIKNWATKSAAYVKCLQPRYRLVLTGTPMENRIDELASIFDWVDDFALEPKWRLAPWHVTAGGRRQGDRRGAESRHAAPAARADACCAGRGRRCSISCPRAPTRSFRST